MYFDNAATSFPKPEETVRSVTRFITEGGGNPGRGGHPRSIDAARLIYEARDALTRFINGGESERLIFTQNGTESLNLAILGLLRQDDHVVTTSLEHNSVMRPLDFLMKTRHIEVDLVPCSPAGELDLAGLRKSLKKKTRAVIINHGSNVLGTIQPIDEIRRVIGERILILDACQTIGNIPIDIQRDGVDIACFSCHKALFGIQGLGALYVREGIDLVPLKFGGTGSRSDATEQPEALPDKYESGTPSTPAIAGLLGGLQFIGKVGLTEIAEKKGAAACKIVAGLRRIQGIRIYGEPEKGSRLPLILINVEGREPSDVGYELNRRNICVRVGLHCSPIAHRTIGTFPGGAVRISPGYFTTETEIDRLLEALTLIAER